MSNFAKMTSLYPSHKEIHSSNRTSISSLSPKSSSSVSANTHKPFQNRKRGVVLTHQGWQKLMQAEVLYDDFGKRYTHEELSERSLLDARTVSRILSCEIRVDKRTLKIFFQAFNLRLEPGDYNSPQQSSVESNSTQTWRLSREPHSSSSSEEIRQLKQQIMQNYSRLLDLLGLDNMSDSFRKLSELIPSE
ncbi:MAG TPA: hypothetical protein V6C57_19485 [Coleofasciculaceae cyanobacterium]